MAQQGVITLGLVFIALLAFGCAAPFEMIYPLQVLSIAGLTAIQGVGLNLLIGSTGQISLGQMGFAAVGAYVSGWLLKEAHWPFELGFFAGCFLAGSLGVAVGFSAWRLRGQYLAMATLAFGGIVYGLICELEITGGTLGMLIIPPISIFGHRLLSPQDKYLAIWSLAALVTAAILNRRGPGSAGRWWLIRDDEIVAAALGINVARYKISVFVIGAVLSGNGRRDVRRLSGRHGAEPVRSRRIDCSSGRGDRWRARQHSWNDHGCHCANSVAGIYVTIRGLSSDDLRGGIGGPDYPVPRGSWSDPRLVRQVHCCVLPAGHLYTPVEIRSAWYAMTATADGIVVKCSGVSRRFGRTGRPVQCRFDRQP